MCLNTQRGFRNGLRAALTLVGQCSAEYFNQHGAKLVTVLTHQVIGKLHSMNQMSAVLACQVLKLLQCPLDIATLDIAAALLIATSTPMELGALALHK